MRPSFLCMGFQKCGTTTLFDLLLRHRGVALPRDVKEPMYYRVPLARAIGGKKYYEWRYFSHLPTDEQRVVGEVNAGLTLEHCAQRLKRDFSPETKLIFMMRNPVNRAWSAYKFFLALGFLPLATVRDDEARGHAAAFDRYVHEVLDNPKKRGEIMKKRQKYLVFSQGCYESCIREYDGYFPRHHYILFEEFIRDQKTVCEELYKFIGVEPDEEVPYGIRANETHKAAAGPLRARWREWVKGFDYILDELIGMREWAPPVYGAYHKFNRAMYRVCLKEDSDRSKMLPETRAYLEDYYRPEKEAIERRLGRDLSGIWY